MPIQGLTDEGRLPRLGKIRLGIKHAQRGYPIATDYLVCPPEVQAIYGEMPTALDPVLIPLEDENLFASTYYRYYTQTYGLTCKGDGETAYRTVDMDALEETGEPAPASSSTRKPKKNTPKPISRMEVGCPCPLLEQGLCRPIMNFQFMLPKVEGLGIWQIDTSSINSIKNLLGSLKLIKAVAGRISGIPLKLSLVPMEVTPEGESKKTVRVLDLRVSLAESIDALTGFARRLPAAGLAMLPPEPDDEAYEEPMTEALPAPKQSQPAEVKTKSRNTAGIGFTERVKAHVRPDGTPRGQEDVLYACGYPDSLTAYMTENELDYDGLLRRCEAYWESYPEPPVEAAGEPESNATPPNGGHKVDSSPSAEPPQGVLIGENEAPTRRQQH